RSATTPQTAAITAIPTPPNLRAARFDDQVPPRPSKEETEMAQIGDSKGAFTGIVYRNDADLKAWLAKRPRETALEPELPIIDPPHHFWDNAQRGRDFLPAL